MKISLIFKRILFYVLSLTWGALLSIPGLIIIAVLAIQGKVHCYHGRLYGIIGDNWGGFNLGCVFLVSRVAARDTSYGNHTRAHESGHGLQNMILGPFMLFIITIPSVIRYWYRNWMFKHNADKPLPSYDAIWFEGQASALGVKYVTTDKI